MKITYISKAPTLVYPLGRPGGVLVEPGASYEGDFDDGQAAAHADDKARLLVEGFKPGKKAPAAGAAGDDKTLAKVTAERDDLAEKLEEATTRADNAEALLAERDATIADLGDQDVAEDDADDLRKQALGLGIKVDKRWTDETVQRKIDEKLAE